MNNRTKIFTIAGLVLIAGIIYVEYPKQEEQPVACTMEAKICPDGSSVGRTGPKCEFSACPASAPITSVRIGQKITVSGVAVTPVGVVEDSRCPTGVMCIQAGTVRLKVKLEAEGRIQTETIKLGSQFAFNGRQVTLTEVTPVKFAGKEIVTSDYSFTFSVSESAVTNKGTLKGSVTIGPVCPVEMAGYPCTPTAEMYAAAQVFVYMKDKTTLVATLTPDKDGKFSVQLAPGTYFIDMIHQRIGGTTGVPTTVNIMSGVAVTLSLHVDTGLR